MSLLSSNLEMVGSCISYHQTWRWLDRVLAIIKPGDGCIICLLGMATDLPAG
jgi:hypothetical protein